MKKILIIAICLVSAACTGKSVRSIDSLKKENQNNIGLEDNQNELSYLSFRELVDRIPITPLPFGIEGLDTMLYYKPASTTLYEDLWRDSLNVYGLNSFFRKNKELVIKKLNVEDYSWIFRPEVIENIEKGYFYFSQRFPPHNDNEYLLFYTKQSPVELSAEGNLVVPDGYENACDYWMMIVCNNDGSLIEYPQCLGFAVGFGYDLYYMDESYNITEKSFDIPPGVKKLGEEKYTVMISHDGIIYKWIDNKPVEVKQEGIKFSF